MRLKLRMQVCYSLPVPSLQSVLRRTLTAAGRDSLLHIGFRLDL